MPKSIGIRCQTAITKGVETARRLLSREIEERSGIRPGATAKSDLVIELDVRPGVGREGFRIEDGAPGVVRIVGNDERGLLYGVGKLLRSSRFAEGDFRSGAWRGTSVPQKEVRGMYFATHFHNFYHDAPVQDVQRYVEDLALWGCNSLMVWFDMHHYTGIEDPAAQAMIKRLHDVLRAANGVGMGAALLFLANEAYANSPESLRSVPTPGIAHYHVELCPNIPGATKQMLKWREDVLQAFSDLDIEQVCLWPHDQGGCACKACEPWGGNGFVTISEEVAHLSRRYFPRAKVILSTWCFDYEQPGEWAGLAKRLAEHPGWADYIMAEGHGEFPKYPLEQGVPGGLPMLNFPEISMQDMYPWGGFGINPLPNRLERVWKLVTDKVAGGYPYSEGIFEDMNKAVTLMHCWDGQDAMQTVREYVAYEHSADATDDLVKAVELMDVNSAHTLTGAPLATNGAAPQPLYKLGKPEVAEECLSLVKRAERRMTERARRSWRWRLLWLRAALDADLSHSGGLPTEESEEYFEELTRVYWAENADARVAPPSVRSLRRLYPRARDW